MPGCRWLFCLSFLVAGCGGAEPRDGETFTLGWILLFLLVIFLLFLFVAVIRYVVGGRKKAVKPEDPGGQDFE